MKINRCLVLAGIAAALWLGGNSGLAQNNPGQGGQGGRQGRGNFDPAQFRERMMERVKENLEVTDDSEWKVIQPLVSKVMDARQAIGFGGGMRMFGPRRGAGDNNADQGGRRMGPPPSADAAALQKAIDAKASNSELKTAVAKYAEARKQKQADLEKAQAELRKVLSVRQEAIATLDGLL
jgi:hypothetical protein